MRLVGGKERTVGTVLGSLVTKPFEVGVVDDGGDSWKIIFGCITHYVR